ncbi:MAG: sugar-binding protein [Treponema sp.]|nr:sugar-binding protein [Treponema sp.]
MKKLIAFGLAALMVTGSLFVSCNKGGSSAGGSSAGGSSAKATAVGVSMPTKDLQRWNQDGENMKKKLEEAGYKVDLQYANNDIATQTSQIENMITKGDKVLVIASIDGSALKNVLDSAKKKGIKVIAYDRLIMNSDAVSYYATFDNYKVGTIQGDFLVDRLNLKSRSASNPVYMELFTGSPDDNNINFFFGGAMDVLKPYIDSGVIVVPSGQTSKAQCATLNWSTEEAQKRMENLITSQGYGPKGKKLDAVYSSNDSCAMGITNALEGAGYTAENFPLITGQDCDKPSVKNMLKGTQAMSIFKDTRTLADKVVGMVDAIMQGKEPEINDTKTYDNGTGIIPSYLCDPVFATTENYKSLLIDSGYYKESDLQ